MAATSALDQFGDASRTQAALSALLVISDPEILESLRRSFRSTGFWWLARHGRASMRSGARMR